MADIKQLAFRFRARLSMYVTTVSPGTLVSPRTRGGVRRR